jgi:hypothetical protein
MATPFITRVPLKGKAVLLGYPLLFWGSPVHPA